MKNLFFILLIFFFFQFSLQAIEPAWQASFEKSINWQKVTNLGYLIVNTTDGLHGIDPESGDVIWTSVQFANLPIETFKQVEGSPFFKIEVLKGEKPQVYIINPVDGQLLFDSSKEEVSEMLSYNILPKSNQLLVVAIKKGNSGASLFMYNIENGEKSWVNDKLFSVKVETGLKGGLGAFANKFASEMGTSMNAQGLITDPIEISATNMLLIHPNFVYSIDTEKGEEKWKFPIEGGGATTAKVYFKDGNKDIMYLSTEKKETRQVTSSSEPTTVYYNPIFAINIENGSAVWKKQFVGKGQLNDIIFDKRGLIVCPRAPKPFINMVDYNTGEGQWGKKGKGLKIKGAIVGYNKLEGNYAITTGFDNAWNNAGEEYYLNVLNPETATLKFEKYEKLKGNLRMSKLVDKGMLYVTSREINILDLTTGSNIFSKSIEAAKPLDPSKYDPAKHGLPFRQKEDKLYAYSSKSNTVYEVDTKAATMKPLMENIKFEGKEEPSNLEITEDGIILSSDQNILKIGFNGNKIYHTYYPAPKQPGLLKVLHAANAIRAAYYTAAFSAASADLAMISRDADDANTKKIASAWSDAFADGAEVGMAYTKNSAQMVFKRFKASAKSPNYMFVLTEPVKRQYALYQVSKTDGQKKEEINLGKDKEPSYEVDQIYSYIYYKKGENEIACYKF